MKKTAHLVLANPNPESFNYAIAHETMAVLKAEFDEVILTDLYALSKEEHPAIQHYHGEVTAEQKVKIRQEQDKWQQANLVIFQFPIYWFSMPSIMHSYLEQVLTPGFAYPGKFENSPLAKHKPQVIFSVTTQSGEADYQDSGYNGSMRRILFPLATALRFVGHEILLPFATYQIGKQSLEERVASLNNAKEHMLEMIRHPKIWIPVNHCKEEN